MGQIKRGGKRPFLNIGIRSAFVLYVIISLLIATAIFLISYILLTNAIADIENKYGVKTYRIPEGGGFSTRIDVNGDGETFYMLFIEDAQGNVVQEIELSSLLFSYEQGWKIDEETGETVQVVIVMDKMTSADSWTRNTLYTMIVVSVLASYISAVIICAFVFYHRRIEPPVDILISAYEKVQNSDLDFDLKYELDDEMGKLVTSFNSMKDCLAENYRNLWTQMEERKRINAAFAHDLRTPLTVLRGNLEWLEEEGLSEEERQEAVDGIRRSVVRLEQFTEAMSRLQRLGDYEVKKREVAFEEVLNAAENSARTLSKRNLRFSSEGDGAQKIWVDVEVLCHTLENVVSNADRYAEENIWVSVSLQNAIMRVTVEDDGRGFSKAALAKATNPFFKENSGGENLGLGLNICETLCRLHGGGLMLSNTDRGGKVELSFGVSVRS